MNNYDIIIVGAGSIGIPVAMALSNTGLKTVVIDKNTSPGQGDNKKAIGGIRATHSDPSKIIIGKRSIEIFSTWKEIHGNEIEWNRNGYLFPVYRNLEKTTLINSILIQQKFGLKVEFIDSTTVKKIIPVINSYGLIGGSYSPNDGSASPLLSINAFAAQAIKTGTKLKFKEKVKKIIVNKNTVSGVITDKDRYNAPIVIDAAGTHSSSLCQTVGINLNIEPDLHEAAITEPINHMFKCMIVDLRPKTGSKNFYLYQNIHGQIIFCITPNPSILGKNTNETSKFLPLATKRTISLIPSLQNIRIRRMWRGCYPMTPDGSPIVGWNKKINGLFHSTGMCGQGFMLGPGIGELISRIINKNCSPKDKKVLDSFSPQRKFYEKEETLK